MAEGITKWKEDDVVAAFNNFRNVRAAESPQEAEATLRGHLKNRGEGPFGPDDIVAVAGKMVPFHCANQMAGVVVDWLNDHACPVAFH